MWFLTILKRLFLLPLEVQALQRELRAERAKTSFHEHIIDTQDVVLRRALHLLTIVGDSMDNEQTLHDFQDGVKEMPYPPVDAPDCLPDNLTEEFDRLSPFVQQYIVSLARETEGNVTSTTSLDAGHTEPKKD